MMATLQAQVLFLLRRQVGGSFDRRIEAAIRKAREFPERQEARRDRAAGRAEEPRRTGSDIPDPHGRHPSRKGNSDRQPNLRDNR